MGDGDGRIRSLSVDRCDPSGREAHAVVSDLEGVLLVSRSPFPYFMLLALEAGSHLRGLALLLVSPLALFLQFFVSEPLAVQLLVFVSVAGLHIHDIQKVARVVLPRFYAADVHANTWQVFKSCGRRRVVVTTSPTVMVAPFVREYLGGDEVVGTELGMDPATGKATGFVTSPGVLVGQMKKVAVENEFPTGETPELGLWGVESVRHFSAFCKVSKICPFCMTSANKRHSFLPQVINNK